MPWAHGGAMRGTSPARIGFLRKLVEETASAASRSSKRTGLEGQPGAYYLNASTLDVTGKMTEEILYYMDFHQPIYYEFPLPQGKFTAEMIDPWAMKVSLLPGTFGGKTKLRLTGRPNQAVRFRRVR
jgi:hypothetical protein